MGGVLVNPFQGFGLWGFVTQGGAYPGLCYQTPLGSSKRVLEAPADPEGVEDRSPPTPKGSKIKAQGKRSATLGRGHKP